LLMAMAVRGMEACIVPIGMQGDKRSIARRVQLR
jgi:hypothetical protein